MSSRNTSTIKVLQICNKPPFPPVDGGCLAMHSITEMLLNENIQVTVLAINTDKHPYKIDQVPQTYINQTEFKTAYVNTRINPINLFLNLFTDNAYNIERFFSKNFEELIISVLSKNQFDIIQFESIYVLPYLNTVKKHSSAKIILRAHNIEHKLWERRATEEKNIFKKNYLDLLASRIKNYETDLVKKLDGVVSITTIDENYFKSTDPKKNTITIPFGINTARYSLAAETSTNPSVFFIGSLDWQPNVTGLLWFVENVWQKNNFKNSGAQLYIAGKNASEKTIEKLPSKSFAGQVPDALAYMSKYDIMVVPLFSGGGMRVKIIEGMALGKTIITTTIGAEGIPCTPGKNILIANTEKEFSESILKCIQDKNYRDSIGEKAKEFIYNNFDNKVLGKKLINFFNTILVQ